MLVPLVTNIPAIPAPSAAPVFSLTEPARKQSLSPIGQPYFLLRAGVAESDRMSYFGGLSYGIPISAGIHILSIRIDGDIWEHFSSPSGGGTALSANAIFGPNSGYFGAGVAWTARINHASGPEGPGIKIIAGSQPIPVIGYEFDAIIADRGVMGDARLLIFNGGRRPPADRTSLKVKVLGLFGVISRPAWFPGYRPRRG